MSLHIVFSNRIENLAALLQDDLARVPADPFEPQDVVVPTTAVARYLQLTVAKHTGICANVKFSYLARWLWELAGNIDRSIPERSPVDPGVMTWMILSIFDQKKFLTYPRLAAFLKDADDLMRFELAQALAHVFDQYATYRPDWLEAWYDNREIPDFHGQDLTRADECWQREIWRTIASDLNLGKTHPLEAVFEKIKKPGHPGSDLKLPRRAAIFNLPVIPPLYLRTICRLSDIVDLTLYVMNPCREYWFDIVPRKRLTWLTSVKRDAHQEVGHLLLAEWGQSTQSAIDLVYEVATSVQTSESGCFQEPEGKAVIQSLQRSILNMEDLKACGLEISETDRSIEIHCCHGAIRELEVLHNRILDLFNDDITLRADDVLVLTPDIDAMAPAIDAVFGTMPETHKIPYLIAGRSMAGYNPFLRVLIELLDLLDSRMPASRVFDFLCQPSVAKKFDLDDQDLERIRSWTGHAGIHWGLDGKHREKVGATASGQYTFQGGLDSLMLGLALPHLNRPFAEVWACENLEGSRAETLGKFWSFIERLVFWKNRIGDGPKSIEWQAVLNTMLDDFVFCEQGLQGEYDRVLGAIAGLCGNWLKAGFDKTLSTRVVRATLINTDVLLHGAVPSGVVTFAPLASMRGLAYRVVCLIGMNEKDFPGRDETLEFDLIPKGHSRRGDRQRRQENRGVFLDAVLAARDVLHISYTGRDQLTNTEMPPSVLVSQLLDYLVDAVFPVDSTPEDRKIARLRFTVNHPLQPFSRRYFDGSDPRLTSYAGQYADALNRSISRRDVDVKFNVEDSEEENDAGEDVPSFFNGFPASKSFGDHETESLTMNDLSAFLRNPSRHFLEKRMLISLPERDEAIENEDPLIMDFSGVRSIAQNIIAACVEQNRVMSLEEALEMIGPMPQAPPKSACSAGLTQIWPRISSLAERLIDASVDSDWTQSSSSILDLPVQGKTWHLEAALESLRINGVVKYRCDDLRGYDQLQAWLDHLILCILQPEGIKLQTRHIALDRDVLFDAISPDEAVQYLSDLIALYSEGLTRCVPFFRKAAWGYMENNKSLTAAKNKWQGGYGSKGSPESEDIWHALAWRGIDDPVNDEFVRTARRVIEPILAHRHVTEIFQDLKV